MTRRTTDAQIRKALKNIPRHELQSIIEGRYVTFLDPQHPNYRNDYYFASDERQRRIRHLYGINSKLTPCTVVVRRSILPDVETASVESTFQDAFFTVPAELTPEWLVGKIRRKFKDADILSIHGLHDVELLEAIRKDLDLVRGKTMRAISFNFGHKWGLSECRTFQKKNGFDGNAGAYLYWMILTKPPLGSSKTIANDDSRLHHNDADSSRSFALSLLNTREECWFGLRPVDEKTTGGGSIIAFQNVT